MDILCKGFIVGDCNCMHHWVMNRKVDDLFPTIVVRYENPQYENNNSKFIETVNNLVFQEGMFGVSQTADHHLHIRDEFKSLFEWIQDCLYDYKKFFDYDCDNLTPCLSWINKSTKFSEHRYHSHPNSFLSAIYYISTNPTSTYFESPNTSIFNGIVVNSKSKFNQNVWSSGTKSGDLIIFPSSLYHWTQPENFDGERLTLSLNIMPTGVVNKNSLLEFKYVQ